MKLFTALSLLPLGSLAAFTQQDYDSGRVHELVMQNKFTSWNQHKAHGDYKSGKWRSWEKWRNGPGKRGPVKCKDGLAIVEHGNPNQTFQCKDMDLYDFKSHADLGSFTGEGSSSWGWTSEDGREFIAVGQADGTAFAEISKNGKLVYLGRLPQHSVFSIWREIRSYYNYMIIGSEARGHGVQIFDMKKLLDIDPRKPVNFSTTADVTGHFNDLPVGRTHNVVVNEELGYAVAVGAQPRNSSCAAGLIYIDLSDPSNPTSPGCAGQDGYVHDAQCLVYHGPDERYEGRDICYGYNEDTLTIYDVTDKKGINSSSIISRTSYVGASYTHQGWVLDKNNQEFLLMNDELDEVELAGPAAARQHGITFIWDIRDLENPINSGYFENNAKSIDHNLYIDQGLATLSNYGAGVRILDVSGIPEDPTGGNVEEVAFFDIYPEDDAIGGLVDFVGTWSHFAFPSGYVFVNTIERGGFVVKMSNFRGKGRGKKWRGN